MLSGFIGENYIGETTVFGDVPPEPVVRNIGGPMIKRTRQSDIVGIGARAFTYAAQGMLLTGSVIAGGSARATAKAGAGSIPVTLTGAGAIVRVTGMEGATKAVKNLTDEQLIALMEAL